MKQPTAFWILVCLLVAGFIADFCIGMAERRRKDGSERANSAGEREVNNDPV